MNIDKKLTTIGIDLSLTGTGIVAIGRDYTIIDEFLIRTNPKTDIEHRIIDIGHNVIEFINTNSIPIYIYMEGLSFASTGKRMFQSAGLHYYVRAEIIKINFPITIISPTELKKFVTGKGNSKKEMMLLKTFKRWGVEFNDNNLCDAYGLARIGMNMALREEI